jgi:hypothetical protein
MSKLPRVVDETLMNLFGVSIEASIWEKLLIEKIGSK